MVDVEKCIEEFLEPKKLGVYNRKYGWHDELVTHKRENMVVLIFNNGDGVAIIDNEQFSTLPKTKQNKFLKLCK